MKAIRKFDYQVKCISQINGGLIIFFGNQRIILFKFSWLDCGQCGKNQHKKKKHNNYS